jgi:hypothetical protein
MGDKSEQDQLDDELEQEQEEEQAQQAKLKKKQDELKRAEMANMKRTQGAGMAEADMANSDDEDPLG